MKIALKRMMSLGFIAFISLMLFACKETTETTTAAPTTTVSGQTTVSGVTTTQSNQTTTSGQPDPESLDGEYEIDITNLGMPLIFFLKIEGDDFYLGSDRTYAVDKGHGEIASSGGTYMFIYSDSTITEPKTTTFTFEDGNIHFSTPLYYGSSTLQPSKVDDEDPEITYYLVGKTLLYEEYYGEYAGSHEATAMAGTIQYEYSLVLMSGTEFTFLSTYETGGTTYDYEESGFYRIDGSVLSLYPAEQDEVIGSIVDSEITVGIKPSPQAERAPRTLQLAVTASCAGTYTGYSKETAGELQYETNSTLILDKFGGYIYTAIDVESGTVEETGSFTISGSNLTFSPADSDEDYTGTLLSYQVTAPFPVSTASTERISYKHYCQIVQGTFTAEGEDAEENTYVATLTLHPDGTFDLVMVDDQELEIVNDYGTFVIMGSMMNLIGENVITTIVSARGININIEIAPEVEVGFLLKKE